MKINILVTLILLVCISINAQTSKIKFGIKSGINISKHTPDLYVGNSRSLEYQGKIGFYIGGYSNIKISENLEYNLNYFFLTKAQKEFLKISQYLTQMELLLELVILKKL